MIKVGQRSTIGDGRVVTIVEFWPNVKRYTAKVNSDQTIFAVSPSGRGPIPDLDLISLLPAKPETAYERQQRINKANQRISQEIASELKSGTYRGERN